jgi:O-antigen/teichoic acid export membrane protein
MAPRSLRRKAASGRTIRERDRVSHPNPGLNRSLAMNLVCRGFWSDPTQVCRSCLYPHVVLGRAVAWNVFGQAGALAVGFISSILVTRWLGPADRGLLAVIAYSVEVVVAVAGLGLTYATVYFVSVKNARAGAVLGNSLLYGAILALTFIPLGLVFGDDLADLLSDGQGTAAWQVAGVYVPVLFLDWTIHNQLFGRLRFDLLNLAIVGSRVAALGAALVLVGIMDLGVPGAIGALMCSSVTMIGATLWALSGSVVPSVDLSLLRTMIGYGLRVSVGWIFQIVNFRVDVIIVQQLTTLRDVGYYVIAQVVAELALTFSTALQSSVTTLTAREEDERQDLTTISSIRHSVLLTTAAAIAVLVLGPILITVGYGPAFNAGIVPMLILLPAMIPIGIGQVVTGNLRGRERPGVSSMLAGVTMILTLILDLLLIPRHGIVGAAEASLVAYSFFGVSSLVTLSRIAHIPVRILVVPTRAEFRPYVALIRRGLEAVTRRSSRA